MEEFKAFDGGEPFVKPEKPFMLVYEDKERALSISWLETEDDLLEVVEEIKGYGCRIIDAIEIGSYRDVESVKIDE